MIKHLLSFAILFMLVSLFGCNDEVEQTRKVLGTASGCDAAIESCQIVNGPINVSLTLGPDVKPLVAFPVQLQIDGGEVIPHSVIADFQMQGMDMGMNRYRLQSLTQGKWNGKATLPVCTTSRMDWLAVIEFSLDGQPYSAIFPFHTESN